MGGCATKLKGVKADAGDFPPPEPAPPAKEDAGVVSETKKEAVEVVEEEKKVVVQEREVKEEEEEGDKDREIRDGDKVDEQASKRRSLSLLFKEVRKRNFFAFISFSFSFSVFCWFEFWFARFSVWLPRKWRKKKARDFYEVYED